MYCKALVYFLFILLVFSSSIDAQSQTCGQRRPYCKSLSSCKEALFFLEVCGYKKLDRDGDGIPCESICGKRLTPVLKAMKQDLKLSGHERLGLVSKKLTSFQCGSKKFCREMTSCEEATFYFKQCSLKYLDGDKDGSPCNRLCR